MSHDDCRYLKVRADTELEAAKKATHPLAAQAHFRLADIYLERLRNEQGCSETAGITLFG